MTLLLHPWRVPLALWHFWRDLRRPYSHRCPVCAERVGPDLGLHCRTEHTPEEITQAVRKVATRR